ncbi:MAG: glycosyltransferase [Myxococcota bacterium]
MKSAARDRVGAVVIGRNEGDRLARALEAAAHSVSRVVYVDSDSSDGSRERAAALGATVIHLDAPPFTPSRGRQVGLEALLEVQPDLEFVQFIDGDCILDPDWVGRAVQHLEAQHEAAAVFGRRREERTEESLYSRLMDVDWEHAPGWASHFGGDCLVRASALQAAGGWSGTTINAEDVDLSFRLRAGGWKLLRVSDPMTLHDVRMHHFGEYWRRALRAGYGYAEVGWRHRGGAGRLLLRRMASALLYGALLPVVFVAGLPLAPLVSVAVALVYLRLGLVLYRFARRRHASRATALAYAALNVACKPAACAGAMRFVIDRLQGRTRPRDALIVYRDRGAGGDASRP